MSKLWLDKRKLSKWAYWYCANVEDKFKVRKLITTSFYSYLYCVHIKDRPEIRQFITNPVDCRFYCRHFKYDEDLAKIAKEDGYKI